MRKVICRIVFALGFMSLPVSVMAQVQTAVIKAGTVVNLQAMSTVYARDVEIGDNVKFKVTQDVKSGGMVLIPAGTLADGIVSTAQKSSVAGTKGRLSIDLKSLILSDGTQVPLNGVVRVTGKNRTPLAVVLGVFVWPCIFIPGTKAVMTEGYDTTATVVANTEVPIAE